MNPLMAVGGILAGVNAIGRLFGGGKQVKEAKKINPVFNQYQTNPFAKQQLGLAQQLYGGRMYGASQLQNNIFSNQANTIDAVNRNATDSSQALAMAAAAQGTTNEALSDLQIKEAQNKYNMLGNLNRAYGTMIDEGDKEYESMKYKFETDAARKDALMNAGKQNKYGAVSDMSSLAFTLGSTDFFKKGGGAFNPLSSRSSAPAQLAPVSMPQIGGVLPRTTPNFR